MKEGTNLLYLIGQSEVTSRGLRESKKLEYRRAEVESWEEEFSYQAGSCWRDHSFCFLRFFKVL